MCINLIILILFPNNSYYAKLKKMEEEREKELAEKYRDRVCVCDKIFKQLYIY